MTVTISVRDEPGLASAQQIFSSTHSRTKPLKISGAGFVEAELPSSHPTSTFKALRGTQSNINLIISSSIDDSWRNRHCSLQASSLNGMVSHWVTVLRPTQHKTGRSFRRHSPSQSLGSAWKNETQHNKSTHSPIKTNVLQHKISTKNFLRHRAWKWKGPILYFGAS